MTESLKFLQNMQEITQLEIDQLDASRSAYRCLEPAGNCQAA